MFCVISVDIACVNVCVISFDQFEAVMQARDDLRDIDLHMYDEAMPVRFLQLQVEHKQLLER